MSYHCVDCGEELLRCSVCPCWLHRAEVGMVLNVTEVLCRPCTVIFESMPRPATETVQ